MWLTRQLNFYSTSLSLRQFACCLSLSTFAHDDKTNMRLVKLGSSDLMVTEMCLGTMTWGCQNTIEDAHEQLDYAVKERGVNFIDTAEVYSVPTSDPNWQPGTTENFIGKWIANNPAFRSQIVLATKVVGYSPEQVLYATCYTSRSHLKPWSRSDCRSFCTVSVGSAVPRSPPIASRAARRSRPSQISTGRASLPLVMPRFAACRQITLTCTSFTGQVATSRFGVDEVRWLTADRLNSFSYTS
jgi:Aldo/keto reductase family